MDPKQPGFPTSPYYTPVSTSTGSNQTLDDTTGRMGVYSIAGTNVAGIVLGVKRPGETKAPSELPDRKIAKTAVATAPETESHNAGQLCQLMLKTRSVALETAWTLQRLQSRSTGFSSTLIPIPAPLPSPPHHQQKIKTEPVSPPRDLTTPLWGGPPSPVSYKVPGWLKNMPSTPSSPFDMKSAFSNFDDAIAPVGESRKRAKPVNKKKGAAQKKTLGKDYQKDFAKWAEEFSLQYPKHSMSASALWGLSDFTSTIAAGHHFGHDTFDKMSSEKRMKLFTFFSKARNAKKTANKKGILSLSGLDTSQTASPSPVPSSTISKFSNDTGYSTATTIHSLLPSLPDVKPALSSLTTAPAPSQSSSPLARAILTNPNKNRCFINATVHYLKAVLSPEEQSRLTNLVHLPEDHKARIDPVVMAFARLYQAMEQSEGGLSGADQRVISELESLIIACLSHPYFSHCVYSKEKRKTRKGFNSPVPPEQRLRQLEHDDASYFYMPTWRLLRQFIPSMNQVSLYQEMQTVRDGATFTKKPPLDKTNPDNDGCEPFIAIKFNKHTNLQEAIEDFFATVSPSKEKSDNLHWESQPHSSRPDTSLPEDYYPTSTTFRLGAYGFLKHLHLRLEVQELNNHGSEKLPICKELRHQVFDNIEVPVEDLDTGYSRKVTVEPRCIIAHTGDDLQSGHYVTLEKTDHGWLLHDDDTPAILLKNPKDYLQSSSFDPYLVAYDVV